MNIKNKCLGYLFMFILNVIVAILLLYLCSLLPQAPIDEHVLNSAYQMNSEDENPYFADHSDGTKMSFNSEALMLMESKSLNKSSPENILTNSFNVYFDGGDLTRNYLLPYALGEEPDEIAPYSRYWMGFRVTLRLLLQKLDYFQIRRYTAITFFMLFAAVISSISKNCNSTLALLFGISITLVNPHVIAVSLQSYTCFCIALIAMLLVPFISRNQKWESLFFMEIAIVTMYFDFYTNPLLTFGLPMVYLYLMSNEQSLFISVKRIGRNAISWLSGYGLMWLAKLILTTTFTNENGLKVGINSFLWRLKVVEDERYQEGFGPLDAIKKAFGSVTCDTTGTHIFWIAALLILLIFIAIYFKSNKPFRYILQHSPLIYIGLLPIIWFCVASQPTVIHSYFQYRILSVTFWAVLSYLYLSASGNLSVTSSK